MLRYGLGPERRLESFLATVAVLGQEHVVDSGIDGGDLGREFTPDTGDLAREVTPETINLGMHETPHPEEHAKEDAESREYRCGDVWIHANSVAEATTRAAAHTPPRPAARLAAGQPRRRE